jgi:hypothetical protein
MRRLVTSILLAAGAPSLALAEGYVALLPLQDTTADLERPGIELLEEAIRTASGDALSSFGWTVLGSENTLRVLADNGVDLEKACEASCALEAARELKAGLFLSGSIAQGEDSLVAFLRLFEAERGRQLSSVVLEGRSLRALRLQFAEEAAGFLRTGLERLGAVDESLQPKADRAVKVRLVSDLQGLGSHDAGFYLTLATPRGQHACPSRVTADSSCLLTLAPGDYRVVAASASGFSESIKVPARDVAFRVWTDTSTPRAAGWTLLGAGAATALVGAFQLGRAVADRDPALAIGGGVSVLTTALAASVGTQLLRNNPLAGVRFEDGNRSWRPRTPSSSLLRAVGFTLAVGGAALATTAGTASAIAGRGHNEEALPYAMGGAAAFAVGSWLFWSDLRAKKDWLESAPSPDLFLGPAPAFQ